MGREGGREQATSRPTQTSDSTLIDSIANQTAKAGDGADAARGTTRAPCWSDNWLVAGVWCLAWPGQLQRAT